MHENRILSLLEQGDWGEDAPLIRGLKTYLKDRGIPRGSIFVTRSGRPLDLSRLADILGHTNVNTTRIYTRVSGGGQRRQKEKRIPHTVPEIRKNGKIMTPKKIAVLGGEVAGMARPHPGDGPSCLTS